MVILINREDFIFEVKTYFKALFPNKTIEFIQEASKFFDYSIYIEENSMVVSLYSEGKKIQEESANKEQIQGIYDLKDLKQKRKEQKRLMKGLIYDIHSKKTNIKQPWGILTGIRPTKVVFNLVDKYGNQEDKIVDILRNEYKISSDKIDLMIKVAKKESEILDQNKENKANIYIGIPFCPSKCSYCSFTSFPIDQWKDSVDFYLDALKKEISFVSKKIIQEQNIPIRTIYIGGGTPTSLDEKALLLLMKMVNSHFNLESIEEFTVEAGRPDTITKEKLQILKEYGVDRISINPQTMNQKTLERIGRKHTIEDIYKTYKMAKEIGFGTINMDLIVGLPEETPEDVQNTMNLIKGLAPENLTIHTLANKRGSKITHNQNISIYKNQEEIEEMLEIASSIAIEMGLEPYYLYRQKHMLGNFENVGYAKRGTECIYNVEIIEERSNIIALGAGAVSKIFTEKGKNFTRIENIKDVSGYIKRIDEMIGRKGLIIDKINSL